MRPRNTRLAVMVAAIAVAAVALGGVLAYRQGPREDGTTAAPLSGPTPSGRPSPTPSASPSPTPSGTPSAPAGGPVKRAITLSKLPQGRVPQIPYLVGREVRGGAGTPVTIPGSQQVLEFARRGNEVLAVVVKGNGSELLKVMSTGEVERVPDVATVVTSPDQQFAAYAVQPRKKDGANARGAVIYADDGQRVRKLEIPDVWQPRVLAFTAGKVWFSAGDDDEMARWDLYSWTPGESRATKVTTVASPTALSPDAKVAASRKVASDYGTCSTVNEVATGKQLWRTCEYGIDGFTPDGSIAVGGPGYADGYAAVEASALDARTGNLVRQWTGASFIDTFVEDDQHFLMLADDGPETKRGIIRCTIPTGTCELAVPLTTQPVHLGR